MAEGRQQETPRQRRRRGKRERKALGITSRQRHEEARKAEMLAACAAESEREMAEDAAAQ